MAWPSPRSIVAAKSAARALGDVEQNLGRTSEGVSGGPPWALRRELIDRQVAVGHRPVDAVRHHPRAQDRDPRLDRLAPVRERDRRRRALGEREPSLRLAGPARKRPEPGALDRERRITPQVVLTEPPQPPIQGLHPTVVVGRQRERIDQGGNGVRLAGGVAVDHGGLRVDRGRCTRPSPGG